MKVKKSKKLKERFSIVEFENPSGEIRFRVDGRDKNGKRIRANFPTKDEAQAEKQRLLNEISNLPSMPLVATWLSEGQVREAERVIAELNGKSLTGAVRKYLENYQEAATQRELQAASDEFIADKRLANCRERTIQNLKNRVAAFIKKHPGKFVADIVAEHVSLHIHRPNIGPLTKNTDLTVLSVFFNWAVNKGYRASNPCVKVERVRYDAAEVEALPVADVQKLFAEANAFKCGLMVPYLALSTFCALRPSEVARLEWADIDLAEKFVRVRSQSKTRSRRVVEISGNCIQWLAPFAKVKAPIVGENFRRNFDAVRRLAGYAARAKDAIDGLKPWPADALRHTGGSHHFSLHDEIKTAKWMGNSPAIVHKHYKGLVTKGDSDAFWKIAPLSAPQNVIALAKPEPGEQRLAAA